MNELTKIFDGHVLTIIEKNGEPIFKLSDVCKILGIGNPTDVKNRLDDGVVSIEVILDGLNRQQKATFVNEDGLYDVILDSRKPEAKRFRKWITSEVIPSIRKHGAYMTPETIEQALLNPDTIIQLATNLKEEQKKRKELENENKELKPKATYHDLVLQSDSLLSVTQIAKDFGMGAPTLNKILHELGVQYKKGHRWYLYHQYQDKGYTQSKTYAINAEETKDHMYWTQKGRLFIYEILKEKKGILPNIEKETA